MSKRRFLMPAAIVLAIVLLVGARVAAMLGFEHSDAVSVALVFDAGEDRQRPYVRPAYERALREEGIPFTSVAQTGDLLLLSGAELARRFPAMILADGINRESNPTLIRRLNEYVAAGGSLAIVNDAASLDRLGHFLGHGRLIDLTGVDYVRYGTLGVKSYTTGELTFRDRSTALDWNVPPGKLSGATLTSASYGRLRYPIPVSRVIAPGVDVVAFDQSIPIVTIRHLGRSTIMFVGLPLGYLEAYGDALPLRSIVRTFLRSYVPIPRLVAAPNAVGAMVVGWQIDSSLQWREIPQAIEQRYLRRGERYEFDVAPAADSGKPGDELGFDACGRGEPALKAIIPYGNIGSVASPDEAAPEAACLSREAGYPIRSFALPATGKPATFIRTLDSAKLSGYSYTGDSGAPPTRAWIGGESPARDAWAFPIMPAGPAGSLADMARDGLTQHDVAEWLDQTTAYAQRERSIQSIYSRLDDLFRTPYGPTWSAYLDRLDVMLSRSDVQLLDVAQATAFMDRFVGTDFAFRRAAGELVVTLQNQDGLAGIGFAIPQHWLADAPPPPGAQDHGISGGFHYFVATTNAATLTLRFKTSRR